MITELLFLVEWLDGSPAVHLDQAGGFNDPPTDGETSVIVIDVGSVVFLLLLKVGVTI